MFKIFSPFIGQNRKFFFMHVLKKDVLLPERCIKCVASFFEKIQIHTRFIYSCTLASSALAGFHERREAKKYMNKF